MNYRIIFLIIAFAVGHWSCSKEEYMLEDEELDIDDVYKYVLNDNAYIISWEDHEKYIVSVGESQIIVRAGLLDLYNLKVGDDFSSGFDIPFGFYFSRGIEKITQDGNLIIIDTEFNNISDIYESLDYTVQFEEFSTINPRGISAERTILNISLPKDIPGTPDGVEWYSYDVPNLGKIELQGKIKSDAKFKIAKYTENGIDYQEAGFESISYEFEGKVRFAGGGKKLTFEKNIPFPIDFNVPVPGTPFSVGIAASLRFSGSLDVNQDLTFENKAKYKIIAVTNLVTQETGEVTPERIEFPETSSKPEWGLELFEIDAKFEASIILDINAKIGAYIDRDGFSMGVGVELFSSIGLKYKLSTNELECSNKIGVRPSVFAKLVIKLWGIDTESRYDLAEFLFLDVKENCLDLYKDLAGCKKAVEEKFPLQVRCSPGTSGNPNDDKLLLTFDFAADIDGKYKLQVNGADFNDPNQPGSIKWFDYGNTANSQIKQAIIPYAGEVYISIIDQDDANCELTYNITKSEFETNCESITSDGIFKDTRDQNDYPFVKIGDQDWFQQNLRYDGNGTIGFCPENIDCASSNSYGLYYSFDEVANNNICPNGWRIPSFEDWQELALTTGAGFDSNVLEDKNFWLTNDGSNIYNFSARAYGYVEQDSLHEEQLNASFWTSSLEDIEGQTSVLAYSFQINDGISESLIYQIDRTILEYTCRCIRN